MSVKKNSFFLLAAVICLTLNACANSPAEISPIDQGKKIYIANCLSCHPTDPSQPYIGPDLVNLYNRLIESEVDSAAVLAESILEPGKVITPGYQNLMPAAALLGLSETDINSLIAYLSSLSRAD